MLQMVLDGPGAELRAVESPIPEPGPGQVVLRVSACAICDIDALIQKGRARGGIFPIVPGHEIVGYVQAVGSGVSFQKGQKLGLAWLGDACGQCYYCAKKQDHLCELQRFTGLNINGGFATHVLADARHCYSLEGVRIGRIAEAGQADDHWSEDAAMTPLMCEGSMAFRSYKACHDAKTIGLYGFGTAAQLICQMAKADGHAVYAMTRPGGESLLELARSLGADWTGSVDTQPPELLDAAVLLQPTVEIVPHALSAVRCDGSLVFLGMHISHVPSFPYDLFLQEHSIRSICRSSLKDMKAFLDLCRKITLKTRIKTYPLTAVNQALQERQNSRHGESVLVM